MALANHRKDVGREIARYAALFRRTQLEALAERLEGYDFGRDDFQPIHALVLINALSRTLEQERSLGADVGVDETFALVERVLERLEGPAAEASGTPGAGRRAAGARRKGVR